MLKLKKWAALCAAVFLFGALPFTVFAQTWEGDGFTLEAPENMYRLGPDTDEEDPVWALAGVSDPSQRLKDYEEMNVLADFITEDGKTSVQVMKKETDYSRQIWNLSLLDEEQKQQALEQVMQSRSDDFTVGRSYYQGDHLLFYRIQIDGQAENISYHELVYGTIVNGCSLYLDLYGGTNEISPEQEALMRGMADSLEMGEILEKPEHIAAPRDQRVTIALLALLAAVILTPAIYFPVKKKIDQRKKAELAEKLTEYHKIHGGENTIEGEIRFANSTDCTREAVHGFSVYQSYVKNLGSLLVGVVLCVITLVTSFALNSEWWIRLLAVAIAVYYAYRIFNMPSAVEKAQRKVFQGGVSDTAHYAFYDEAFRVSGVQSASVFPYFQISDVRRNGHYLYLYYGPENAYLVDQFGFTVGEFEEFEAFIFAKAGKKHRGMGKGA